MYEVKYSMKVLSPESSTGQTCGYKHGIEYIYDIFLSNVEYIFGKFVFENYYVKIIGVYRNYLW